MDSEGKKVSQVVSCAFLVGLARIMPTENSYYPAYTGLVYSHRKQLLLLYLRIN